MSASLADLPALLASEIDLIIAGATDLTCTPDMDTIFSGGEPATSVGQCTTVWVWISELYNIGGQSPFSRQGDEVGCVVRPGVTLNIRVDVCYVESEQGPTATQHATTADCLHGLMAAIWCGLAELWADGTLLDLDCRQSALSSFVVLPRQGGMASATMTLDVEHDCAGATS